jgi:drug/metabolite transporter (DMT)-like permease
MTTHRWPGVPLALASAVLFGASTPLAKLLLGAVDPWLMAGAALPRRRPRPRPRSTSARAALWLPAAEAPLRRADLPWLAAVVASGGVAGPLLLMFGLASTDAASVSLLLNLESSATMGLAWVTFRENVDRRLLLGASAILAGAVLLSWSGGVGLSRGALLVAAACLAWGVDNNLTRRLSSADPVRIAMVKGLVAGSVNLALALLQGPPCPGRTRCSPPAWSASSATG